MKKLVETALPLSEIRASGLREHTGAAGHPANLHMWWGRSPLLSTKAALTAALVDAPDSQEELLQRLERLQTGAYTEFGEKPTVFDPFSGFGGIPLIAQDLGLPVIAGDLNPVAVMLTKAASEIPSRFANLPPVNAMSLFKDYTGVTGLAEDVAYYGEWMIQRAKEQLHNLYPNDTEGVPVAWIWVRTAKCPNPACGCQMPLASTYILSGKAGNEVWAEPIADDNGEIHFEIRDGKCPEEHASNKVGKQGAIFRCPVCGSLTTDSYVKQMGQEDQLGSQMMAVVVDTPSGKRYLAPNDKQEAAADVPFPEDIPHGDIPDNAHWFTPPGFGLTAYSDLFSPRQLIFLTTLCDLLSEVQDKAASDALAAGMSETGGSLADGGTGALAYGQAVSVYLSFVIDKLADSNSTICTWRTTGGSLRNTFGRQAIPMTWTYAEGNPFSGITGNFETSLKNVVNAIKKLPSGGAVTAYQMDALSAAYPENVLICSELPYYHSIGYAHLSDYFYIWMRRGLKHVFTELFNQLVTSKNELSTVEKYFGKSLSDCEAEYAANLQTVFKKMYQAANPNYPILLFYEFHKVDLIACQDSIDSSQLTPFEMILSNLYDEGFAISAVWPMRTNTVVKNADGIRILIVARKKERSENVTKRGFVTALKRELPAMLTQGLSAGIDPEDREITGLGYGLSIFTRYSRVMNADGTNTGIHEAIKLIYIEVADWLHHFEDTCTNIDTTAKED